MIIKIVTGVEGGNNTISQIFKTVNVKHLCLGV